MMTALIYFAIAFNLATGAMSLWNSRRWYKLNACLFNCILMSWRMQGWRLDRIIYEALQEEERRGERSR